MKCSFENSQTIAVLSLHRASTKNRTAAGRVPYSRQHCVKYNEGIIVFENSSSKLEISKQFKLLKKVCLQGHSLLPLVCANIGGIHNQARNLTSTFSKRSASHRFGLFFLFSIKKSSRPHVEETKLNLH